MKIDFTPPEQHASSSETELSSGELLVAAKTALIAHIENRIPESDRKYSCEKIVVTSAPGYHFIARVPVRWRIEDVDLDTIEQTWQLDDGRCGGATFVLDPE